MNIIEEKSSAKENLEDANVVLEGGSIAAELLVAEGLRALALATLIDHGKEAERIIQGEEDDWNY